MAVNSKRTDSFGKVCPSYSINKVYMEILKQKKQQVVSARIAYRIIYLVSVIIGTGVSTYAIYFGSFLFFISIGLSYLFTSSILKVSKTNLIELLAAVIKELEDAKGTYKDQELQQINENLNSYNRMLSEMKKHKDD